VEWHEGLYKDTVFNSLCALAEIPFTVMRSCTIPMTAEDSYSRPVLVISLLGGPFWLTYYLGQQGWDMYAGEIPACIPLIMLGVILAVAVVAATTGGRRLPKWAAATLGLLGFVVAASWIDTIASNVVGILQFLGVLLGIRKSVLGLTVLAWGNSIGDLSTNVAMARKGLANMAITACFAGPVFNMLVGLGLGFSSLLHSGKDSNADGEIPVSLSPGLVVGFVFLACNCMMLVGTGLYFKSYVPGWYGYIPVGLYGVYLVLSLVLLSVM